MAASAFSQVAETKEALSKVAQKRNEFEGRLTEDEVQAGRRLISLNNVSVKQAHINKVWRGVVAQSASVFNGIVN